jgi:hypothetical protein
LELRKIFEGWANFGERDVRPKKVASGRNLKIVAY